MKQIFIMVCVYEYSSKEIKLIISITVFILFNRRILTVNALQQLARMDTATKRLRQIKMRLKEVLDNC